MIKGFYKVEDAIFAIGNWTDDQSDDDPAGEYFNLDIFYSTINFMADCLPGSLGSWEEASIVKNLPLSYLNKMFPGVTNSFVFGEYGITASTIFMLDNALSELTAYESSGHKLSINQLENMSSHGSLGWLFDFAASINPGDYEYKYYLACSAIDVKYFEPIVQGILAEHPLVDKLLAILDEVDSEYNVNWDFVSKINDVLSLIATWFSNIMFILSTGPNIPNEDQSSAFYLEQDTIATEQWFALMSYIKPFYRKAGLQFASLNKS